MSWFTASCLPDRLPLCLPLSNINGPLTEQSHFFYCFNLRNIKAASYKEVRKHYLVTENNLTWKQNNTDVQPNREISKLVECSVTALSTSLLSLSKNSHPNWLTQNSPPSGCRCCRKPQLHWKVPLCYLKWFQKGDTDHLQPSFPSLSSHTVSSKHDFNHKYQRKHTPYMSTT